MKKMKSFSYRAGLYIKALVLGFLTLLIFQSCDNQLEEEINKSANEKTVSDEASHRRGGLQAGFQGIVYDSDISQKIANVVITFSKSDENYVRITTSDAGGSYQITLKAGTYYVTATVDGFSSYSSAPGYFVVTGVDGYQTGNFFLEPDVASGYQGHVYNANDFSITIPGTYITFSKSNNPFVVYSTFSGPSGVYKINLPQDKYFGKAQASGYETYDSTPGTFVCLGTSYQTGNFFLKPLPPPGGFQGIVFTQDMSQTIANAVITFSKSDENDVHVVTSDASGSYKIKLKAGTYYVTATAFGFNSYSSAPGYFVVTGVDGYQTGNFFLEPEVASGYAGNVYKKNDFSITIPGAYITYSSVSNPSIVYSTFSITNGFYILNLPPGGYFVKVQASGYATYDTTPGVHICLGTSYQTGNFFLEPLLARAGG